MRFHRTRISRTLAGVAIWRIAALFGVLLLAAGLRSWGLLSGELLWHPDEIFMVVYPLNLLSGDLNPHTFSYPGLHYYLLASIYGVQFLLHALLSSGADFSVWLAERYLWVPEYTRDAARWVSVIYSVATVAATGLLGGLLVDLRLGWRRALTSDAGLLASLLAGVNILLVRQAPLAGMDTPLAFWFAISALGSMRLLRVGALRAYLFAGALVGVCAATKYPGASTAGSVLVAHLFARRGILDRRLWAAGAASVAVFLLLSPYTLLDASSFRSGFLYQLQHATGGRWGIEHGPLYQLWTTLRYGTGLLGWLSWLAICGWALWRRAPSHLVVLAAMAFGYVAVSWGELTFARYVLPLVPLQLALLGDGLCRALGYLRGRLSPQMLTVAAYAVVLAIVAQPAYGAWHVARLQGTPDTRTQAQTWMERNIPPGSTLCNFGGWAGNPQVRTFEDLWWRFKNYTSTYGNHDLEPLREAASELHVPHYSYAVHGDNEEQLAGDIGFIHGRQCSFVILHEHSLPYSHIDTVFHRQLAAEARQVSRFDPGAEQASIYDPMDAYYIPLEGWGVSFAGPRVEVWEVTQYAAGSRGQSVNSVLSRALSLTADTRAEKGDPAGARADLDRALLLEPENTHAFEVLAKIERETGTVAAARSAYMAILKLRPEDSRALEELALLSVERGQFEQAIHWYDRALLQRPRDASLFNNLAVSYRAIGQADTARILWERSLSLQSDYADARFNLGTALYLDGQPDRALPHLGRAVELAPDSAKYHSNTAAAYHAAGMPERAVEFWKSAIGADSNYVDAYYNLAFTTQYDLQQPEVALSYWQKVRHLAPANVDAVMHGVQAQLDLARLEDGVAWLRMFLANNPQHARRAEVERALEIIAAAE
jgi:tetratricopeptide (TPR) repeat protein